METAELKTEEERIAIVATRIFQYYLHVIDYKKKTGVKSFIIDKIPSNFECMYSLVYLEDKYDGKGNWRAEMGMLNDDAEWHTLSSTEAVQFKGMGEDPQGQYSINIEPVIKKVSVMLAKHGVANYFEEPELGAGMQGYFWITDTAWLHIVL